MKKLKKNKVILIIILTLTIIVLGVCLSLKLNDKKERKESDAIKFKKEYEALNNEKTENGYKYPNLDIKENNPFVYASEKEVINTLKNGTGLIYFGFPSCLSCRNAVNVLQYVNANKILYLDVTDIRDNYKVVDGVLTKTKEGTKKYYEMLELLNLILKDYEVDGNKTNEKRIFVPLVVGVKDGKIVGYQDGIIELSLDRLPYDLLTNEEQNKLKLIYDEINAKVSGDACGLEEDQGC